MSAVFLTSLFTPTCTAPATAPAMAHATAFATTTLTHCMPRRRGEGPGFVTSSRVETPSVRSSINDLSPMPTKANPRERAWHHADCLDCAVSYL